MNGIITSISFLGLLLSTGATPASGPADDAEKVAQVKAGRLQEARADWWGFNETDATSCLQNAIDSGVKKLVVPNLGKPWIVNRIFLASDQEIVLEPGAVIEAKKGSFKGIGDALLTSRQRKNITLSGGKGATLRMHKKDYQDKTQYKPAEWRHCVNLGRSENVKVLGLTLASSGGDGVYVNGCKDVVIKDCVIDDNHRQGISVISAVNLLIENCVIKNTQGTSPEAGIDFEPNRKTERLYNMTVRDCTFENNATAWVISASPGPDAEPMSFLFENCKTASNRSTRPYVGGFGANPPFDKITVKMVNCVAVVNGQTRTYTDFWKDIVKQAPQVLDAQKQAIVARVKRMDIRAMNLKPVDEAAYTQAKKVVLPPLRGKSFSIVYAKEGETVPFSPKVLSNYPTNVSVRLLTAPDKWKDLGSLPGARGSQQDLSFAAPKTGTYIIEYSAGHGWVQQRGGWFGADREKTTSPVRPWDLLALDGRVHFLGHRGTFYFYVPQGTAEFYVDAMGSGDGGERIKLSLYDPDGNLVETQDNIGSMSHKFVVSRKDASQGQVWSLKTEKPTDFALEDFYIDLVGIPPILAIDRASLLMPE